MANVNIGVCVSDFNTAVLNKCIDLGVSHIRIDGGVQWHNIETGNDDNYYWGGIDSIISQCKNNGIEVLWILDYNNPLFGGVLQGDYNYYGNGVQTTNNRNAYVDFAKDAANHFASQGLLDNVIFEIWNEPDLGCYSGDPRYWVEPNGDFMEVTKAGQTYGQLVNATVQAVKAAQPSTRITAFSCNWYASYMSDGWCNSAVSQLSSDTINKLYSWGSHPYPQEAGHNVNPESTAAGTTYDHYNSAKTKMVAAGMPSNKICWITETGYSSSGGEVNCTDENITAKDFLCRNILCYIMRGINNFSAFRLEGEPYGITTQGTQPARSNHFKALCQAVNGTQYDSAPVNSNGNYVLKFTGDNKVVYAAWTTGSSNQKTVDGHVLTLNTVPSYYEYTEGSGEPTGGLEDGDYGDIVVSNNGTVMTIDEGVITTNNIAINANIAWSKINKAGAVPSDVGAEPADADLQDHLVDYDNPHGVSENDILPDQAGNSGKFLQTDGTNTAWTAIEGEAPTGYPTPAEIIIALEDLKSVITASGNDLRYRISEARTAINNTIQNRLEDINTAITGIKNLFGE